MSTKTKRAKPPDVARDIDRERVDALLAHPTTRKLLDWLSRRNLEKWPCLPGDVSLDVERGTFSVTNPSGKRVTSNESKKIAFAYQSLQNALRIAQPIGRPKGRPKPEKSGRPPVPRDLAIKVRQAKLDGMNTEEVARRVLKQHWPADKKARNRLRAYIDRLDKRGARLLSNKS